MDQLLGLLSTARVRDGRNGGGKSPLEETDLEVELKVEYAASIIGSYNDRQVEEKKISDISLGRSWAFMFSGTCRGTQNGLIHIHNYLCFVVVVLSSWPAYPRGNDTQSQVLRVGIG